MHVDAMLASMSPRQFDEWVAEHNIEPWGDDWQQAGTVAAVVENAIDRIVSALAGAEPGRPRQPADYYRPRRRSKTEKPQHRYLTADESLRIDRMRCGV